MKKHRIIYDKDQSKKLYFIAYFLVTSFLFSGSALAHRVTIFAWLEGDTVYTESKFSGGRKVKEGRIIVYDQDGNRLLEGDTDKEGKFSFKAPGKTTLKIVLQAGMGHRAEWILSEDEIEGIDGIEIEASATDSHTEKGFDKISRQVPGAAISQEDVQQAVEKALDKKLKPIIKMLADFRTSSPSLKDILGGIGYILGLVGIAAYIHTRKSKSESDNQ